ncbi:hypothetical protein NUU61_001335 [Penicillium alfredii]|uniref:Uncharacterized protein n=1 Tax=Penicillium alfredii TaxID=1506179 RepID=A0A9W9KMJ4_9EURO|nr:uncharacterized protein NUU61_001335 [Penicillium alfredii]KAJ5111705.1 hypothetical protein NUU61_001335 [Penicillium alfredii]
MSAWLKRVDLLHREAKGLGGVSAWQETQQYLLLFGSAQRPGKYYASGMLDRWAQVFSLFSGPNRILKVKSSTVLIGRRSICSHQTTNPRTKAENKDRVDVKKPVTRTEQQGGQGGVVNQRIEEATKAIEGKGQRANSGNSGTSELC